ncbi:MAG: peptide deformylase [bacterium]
MKTAERRTPVIREVVVFGTPVLREKSTPVTKIDAGIRQLAEDMLATMWSRNGVGLAAQQVGETVAVCVIDTTRKLDEPDQDGDDVPMPLVMINPEITGTTGKDTCEEGCLSLPEIYISISRAAEVKATFLDLDGKKQTIRATGLLSRAIQHELDHLNGILLVDRMSAIKRISLSGKLKKMKKTTEDRLADTAR